MSPAVPNPDLTLIGPPDATRLVLLVQADRARHEAALLWRRRTNGLRHRDLPTLRLHRLPVGHLNLVRRAAPQVAVLIAQHLAAGWRAAPAPHRTGG
jgi:hypothetical protein